MALDSKHPEYSRRFADWVIMRDLYSGSRAVKAKGEEYLPATKSMKLDGMKTGQVGLEVYDAYKTRAQFPDYVKMAVEAYLGLLHRNPADIQVPVQLEGMLKKSGVYGESIQSLLQRINEEQLVTGRLGCLLDLPVNPKAVDPLPYIAIYAAESIINWDDGQLEGGESKLNLVVLNESGQKRQSTFEWTVASRYRILALGPADSNEFAGLYRQGVFTNLGAGAPAFVESDMFTPILQNKILKEIPFVFVNSKDVYPGTDEPPLLGLANMCLAIYRGDADYRQNLFMQGQDTLVISGERKLQPTEVTKDGPLRTGAGSLIELEQGGDAKYVGVNSQGLPEQRTALENDHKRAEVLAGQLLDSGKSGDRESGSAVAERRVAQTCTLYQLAWTGAAALQSILKMAARWKGADEDKVKVEPNVEFANFELTGDDMVKMMTARTMGMPLSKKSMHGLLTDKGLTNMPYEKELETIEQEDADDPRGRGVGDLDEAELELSAEELEIKRIAANKPKPKPAG
jgi:hypothetical protein